MQKVLVYLVSLSLMTEPATNRPLKACNQKDFFSLFPPKNILAFSCMGRGCSSGLSQHFSTLWENVQCLSRGFGESDTLPLSNLCVLNIRKNTPKWQSSISNASHMSLSDQEITTLCTYQAKEWTLGQEIKCSNLGNKFRPIALLLNIRRICASCLFCHRGRSSLQWF